MYRCLLARVIIEVVTKIFMLLTSEVNKQVEAFYLVPLYTVSFLVTSVSWRYIHSSLSKARPVWDQRCRQYSTQLHSVFSPTRQDRMSFFQPKLGPFWIYLPSGAKTIQTVLQPSASGQSGLFWLLQVSISRLVPPPAGRMLQTIFWLICDFWDAQKHIFEEDQRTEVGQVVNLHSKCLSNNKLVWR